MVDFELKNSLSRQNMVRPNAGILILIIFFLSAASYAQNFGRPLIKNFTSKDYHLSTETWCIEQDNRGLMYFGANKGILEYDGSGIGLALAKELVELHGGQISVSSEENVGTTFTVQLPVTETGERKPENETMPVAEIDTPNLTIPDFLHPASSLPAPSEKEIILIAEDNHDVRAYIREQLLGNYNIVETEDGEQGLAKAQEIIPDLIITDVMMPKVDGYQLSKYIREDEKTSHIPIVMLTARADLNDKIEGLEPALMPI